jgi:hypothetical protein
MICARKCRNKNNERLGQSISGQQEFINPLEHLGPPGLDNAFFESH